MPLVDPTPRRIMGCPVHFLWDGKGHGRTFVRSGFLGLMAGGMIATGGQMVHMPAVTTAGQVVLYASVAVWLIGQAVSALAGRRRA